MDFEDGGIESDPKINNGKDTLKQNTEPIISFSPERCRFDSTSSNYRKSSTSFSVTDLQVEDPLEAPIHLPTSKTIAPPSSSKPNANDFSNSVTNPKTSSSTSITTTVPSNPSISDGGQSGQIARHPNSHQFQQHNETPQLPSSSSNPLSGTLAINSFSTASTPAILKSALPPSTSVSTQPGVLPTTAHVDTNSIPLMINGSAVSSNNSSTLDLQKRLEKRIAQASAAAAATSSNSGSTEKTKGNDSDSILASILSISPLDTGIASGSASNGDAAFILTSENSIENQITFSPQKTRTSSQSQSAFRQKIPASLWESGSSASDIELLWESKLCPSKQKEESSKVTPDSFMGSPEKKHHVNQLQSGINAKPFVKEKESESGDGDDERKQQIARLSLTSTTTCNEPVVASSASEGSETGNPFVTCSNNNTITSNVNKSSSGSSSTTSESQPNSALSLRNNNATNMTSVSPSAASSTSAVVVVNAGFDIRKVSALLPPQRLAIPFKPNPQLQSSHSTACNANKTTCAKGSSGSSSGTSTETTNVAFSSRNNTTSTNSTTTIPNVVANVHKTSSRKASISETSCNTRNGNGDAMIMSSGNGNVKSGLNSSKLSSEKKPLVQWDSDESEEELSFFPPSKRGIITDNLSIDNMSLSGEEDDLHLTPPRPLAKRCPCDPRVWLDKREISSSNHQHGDSFRRIVSKPCVIS